MGHKYITPKIPYIIIGDYEVYYCFYRYRKTGITEEFSLSIYRISKQNIPVISVITCCIIYTIHYNLKKLDILFLLIEINIIFYI